MFGSGATQGCYAPARYLFETVQNCAQQIQSLSRESATQHPSAKQRKSPIINSGSLCHGSNPCEAGCSHSETYAVSSKRRKQPLSHFLAIFSNFRQVE